MIKHVVFAFECQISNWDISYLFVEMHDRELQKGTQLYFEFTVIYHSVVC